MTMRINQHNSSVADNQVTQSSQFERRFGGIQRLYGEQGLLRINAAHVCVIGVGGVGSWVVEALARSAVGKITLIDMDIVAPSNVNRQLHALSSTFGRDKTAVLKERCIDINPEIQIDEIDDFVSRDNLPTMISAKFDVVVDCIDDFRTKAALIHFCKSQNIHLITVGGAGGQTDPSKIRHADLSRTQHDVLLARTRKLLRQDYGFPKNPKRSFGIASIYSDEQLLYPDGLGGLSRQRPARSQTKGELSNALNCAGGLGSVTHVTASFGFAAAALALKRLADG